MYSLSVSIKALYTVLFYLHCTRRSFGHRKIVLQEINVNLAELAPQGSENRKILDPGQDFA